MSGDQEFLEQFRNLVTRLLHELPSPGQGPQLVAELEGHLGEPPDNLPVVSEDVPAHRMVDADIALAEIAGRDPGHRLVGIGGGDMRHHMTLGDLLQHGRMHGLAVGQVDYVQAATGPGENDHRGVVALGMWLFAYQGAPVAVRQQSARPQYGRPSGSLDVLTPVSAVADSLLAEVRALMEERSVFRGQVVTFSGDPYGHELAGVTFLERPGLSADDVVLPEGLVERVHHHVVGIAEQRDRLRHHGQHLKRGVLLYGPPGTGKTHTMRYLLSATRGTTAVLLSGGSLQHIHTAAKVARAHQPALVVLEDCDLVAEDRSIGMGGKPLLFEVLDALDGIDGDADVAFLLTTNRVTDLERALTQRPGRVDLAVEIPLPDEAGRVRLLRLYAGELFSDEAVAAAAERSAGTTASFAKELVRRAVLKAALEWQDPQDGHLTAAMDDLLADSETLTRSLLGAGTGGPSGPAVAGPMAEFRMWPGSAGEVGPSTTR
ncbi:MAG TPA: ATP-binding protein [Dermatophilaceae bacterium]|nr:ATP-binding protein [Dermatophilaceae bacterium]